MGDAYRYRAFISYSHSDAAAARWLHRRLEAYRVPRQLVGQPGHYGPVPSRPGRCFRDEAELSAGSLTQKLQDALRSSQALIIVCSPRAAASHWVNEEIRFFRSLGRQDAIFALIVDGDPAAQDPQQACFPPALIRDDEGRAYPEPLAADIRKGHDGKGDGFLRLVSGLLGVGYDDLRRREQRRRQQVTLAAAFAALLIAVGMGSLALSERTARQEAQLRRDQADDLVGFMLGDLSNQLRSLGKLDLLDGTIGKTMQYLDTDSPSDLDGTALLHHVKALTTIAEIQYGRGDLETAGKAGQRAVDAGRLLRARYPGTASDLALAAAYYALGEPQLEAGQFDETLANTQAALQLTHSSEDDAAILTRAMLHDQLAYNFAFRRDQRQDWQRAGAEWGRCSQLLTTQLAAGRGTSTAAGYLLRCDTGVMTSANYQNKPEAMRAAADKLSEDIAWVSELFPEDFNVLQNATFGLSEAASNYRVLDEPVLAIEAALAGMQAGRRLLAVEPNNINSVQLHITAMNRGIDLLQRGHRIPEAAEALAEVEGGLLAFAESRSEERRFLSLIAGLRCGAAIQGVLEGRSPAEILKHTQLGLRHWDADADGLLPLLAFLTMSNIQWALARGVDQALADATRSASPALERRARAEAVLDAELEFQLAVPRYLAGELSRQDLMKQMPPALEWMRPIL